MDAVPAMLTIDQVALIYQTSKTTIFRLSEAGEIPFIKVGRLRRFATKSLEIKLGFTIQASHLSPKTSGKSAADPL